MEEQKDSVKENVRRVLMNYMRNPDLLRQEIEWHNEMVHQLNDKVIKLMEFSPVVHVFEVNENGEPELKGSKLDASSHELFTSIKQQNEILLRSKFPDLYVYTDHLEENNGEINDSIFY